MTSFFDDDVDVDELNRDPAILRARHVAETRRGGGLTVKCRIAAEKIFDMDFMALTELMRRIDPRRDLVEESHWRLQQLAGYDREYRGPGFQRGHVSIGRGLACTGIEQIMRHLEKG